MKNGPAGSYPAGSGICLKNAEKHTKKAPGEGSNRCLFRFSFVRGI